MSPILRGRCGVVAVRGRVAFFVEASAFLEEVGAELVHALAVAACVGHAGCERYERAVRKIITPRIDDLALTEATPDPLQRNLDTISPRCWPAAVSASRITRSTAPKDHGQGARSGWSDAARHRQVPRARRPRADYGHLHVKNGERQPSVRCS